MPLKKIADLPKTETCLHPEHNVVVAYFGRDANPVTLDARGESSRLSLTVGHARPTVSGRRLNMWRTYWIRADKGMADGFYAPDLETAFRLARAQWPGASSWACLGSEA